MRIRTQFIVTMLLFGIVLAVVAVSAILATRQVEKAGAQEKIAGDIAQAASELSYLGNDYLMYRENQQLKRWQSALAAFSRQVARLNVDRPEQQALVRNIQENQQRLQEVFESAVSALGRPSPQQNPALFPEFLQVSWSRMAVQSQGLASNAVRLSRLLRAQADRAKQTNMIVILTMIGVFGIYFLVNYLLVQRRTLNSIAVLQAGAKVIGSGDLDFAIQEKRNDEIGDLCHAFNRMTADLKTVTASKADLEREIGERKKVEEALRASEQRWATTLASIGDAVMATDGAGRITFMNAVAEELTGWTLHEAAPKPVAEVFNIINAQTRHPADDPVSKVLREGTIVGLANHTFLVRKDGTEVAIDDSGAPIRDADGKTMGAVLVFRDITERQRAEDALRESEAKYRNLFENMTEEVHFWRIVRDEAGRIKTWRLVDVNPPTLKTWGRKTAEEIRGKTTDEIFGPGATEHYMPVVEKIIREGVPYSFEDYFPNLDKYFRFTSVPLGDYFITTGADITAIKKSQDALEQRVLERTAELARTNEELQGEMAERRKAEAAATAERQRLKDALNMLPAYVVLLTPDYHVPLANRFFEERFAKSEGRRCYEYLFSRTEPCADCESYRVLKTNAPHRWEWTGPDGRHYDIYDFPFTDADGSPLIMEVGLDITERKQAEEVLRESEGRLRNLSSQLLIAQEQERKRIAGELHDSIAASLGAVKFSIEKTLGHLEQDSSAAELLRGLVSLIQQAVEETRRIMADLRPSVLDDLGVMAALNWFCREFQKRHPQLRVDKQIGLHEEEVPESLKTPLFRISQEALQNIGKHSGADLVLLSLRKSENGLELIIQDNGQGFDPAQAAAEREPGRKLGLAGMKERAELSGGSCTIETMKGGGTTICARWPLAGKNA